MAPLNHGLVADGSVAEEYGMLSCWVGWIVFDGPEQLRIVRSTKATECGSLVDTDQLHADPSIVPHELRNICINPPHTALFRYPG